MESRSLRALADTPPVWLAGCIALAWMQAKWLPALPSPFLVRLAGFALIAVSVVIFVAAVREFRRHHTSIIPRERPAALLTGGPYALSRNPIYLADAGILAGLALTWDVASLVLVAAFVAVIQRRFILGEEAGCAKAFGPVWADYAARVRRWL